jgi:hypothetical protein
MPKSATACPRCRQPVVVDVEQLFDASSDPQAKQRLLSGNYNLIRCQNCGYEGNMAAPLVYHDADKELLLTYFPPELGLPVNEQERLVGPMINQVVNRLPNEKRKAYLFRPQTMLTMQTMVERILEADGITKEMLDEQQKRMNLLQRLLTVSNAESRMEVIKQEEAQIDAPFFNLLNRLIEATLQSGDQQGARQLALLQQELLQNTSFGHQLQDQAKEVEDALRSLQEASRTGLTREKLLDLILNAESDARFNALVSYARSGLDYEFFQILASRIDAAATAEEKQSLTEKRDKMLAITQDIDAAAQEQEKAYRDFLEQLLQQPDISLATEENLGAVNEMFVSIVQDELQKARQAGNFDRSGKLQQVMGVIEKASAPPPEIALVQELMAAESDEDRNRLLKENADKITPEFIELLSNLSAQAAQQNENPEVADQIKTVYRAALRFAMQSNLKA